MSPALEKKFYWVDVWRRIPQNEEDSVMTEHDNINN